MPDDDTSHLQPTGWLLGFDVDPDTMSQGELERRLRAANDALWREMNGTVAGGGPGDRGETRQG